jgi:hypothetical protein
MASLSRLFQPRPALSFQPEFISVQGRMFTSMSEAARRQLFLFGQRQTVDEGLHRCLAKTSAAAGACARIASRGRLWSRCPRKSAGRYGPRVSCCHIEGIPRTAIAGVRSRTHRALLARGSWPWRKQTRNHPWRRVVSPLWRRFCHSLTVGSCVILGAGERNRTSDLLITNSKNTVGSCFTSFAGV